MLVIISEFNDDNIWHCSASTRATGPPVSSWTRRTGRGSTPPAVRRGRPFAGDHPHHPAPAHPAPADHPDHPHHHPAPADRHHQWYVIMIRCSKNIFSPSASQSDIFQICCNFVQMGKIITKMMILQDWPRSIGGSSGQLWLPHRTGHFCFTIKLKSF